MLVVITTYKAKTGEEDAVIALHENWPFDLNAKDKLSWELLRKDEASNEFMTVAHFPDKELAREILNRLMQNGWYSRLVSLMEGVQEHTDYISEWRLT